MKIGFDAKRAFHNFRGLGNYSRTLLDGLHKYFPANDYYLFSPPFSDEKSLAYQRAHPGLNVVTPSGILKSASTLWRSVFLARDLKALELDLFHGLSHELPPFFPAKVRSIVTMHDLIFMRYPEFFPWIDRKIYMKKFDYACQRSDLILSICEQTKSDLINLLKVPAEKIIVSYQSCDPLFYHRFTAPENVQIVQKYGVKKDFILFVGAFEERKNALGLIEAFRAVKADVDLVFIGKGPDHKKKMLEKLQLHKLTERTHFLENVVHQELPHFYQSARMLVYPSFFEGFGLPIVEALFSGCPVITSEGSCFPEAGGPKTIYIDPKKPESIAHAINTVLLNESMRQEMNEGGLDYVQRFHQSKTTQHLMSIYRQVGLKDNTIS